MHKSVGKIFFFISLFGLFIFQLPAQDWSIDFAAIDQRARKSPPSLRKDLPALTKYLCENTESDLEKVRSIYVWITTHIGYDWKAVEQDKRINHFILDILDRELALCVGYAQLFKRMSELAGLECEIIHGYAKGTTNTQLPLEEPNHSWNAVKIKGDWYLLDATWGSSTLNEKNEFVLISNDDYFLIRPEQFIRTHLPGNPMWQLLSSPVSARDFMGAQLEGLPESPLMDSLFAFRDTLEVFFALPLPRQSLYNYEQTYSFYPTRQNGEQLGHSLIDYAGSLSDTLEQLPADTGFAKRSVLQQSIIRYCRRARELITFYPWQQELYVGTLINQGVLLYNHQEETDQEILTSDEAIIALLEEAQLILAKSKDSYFNRIARQQCTDYLQVIRGDTR